jgi:RNA polymerase sigma-70 factor (ECF subfamily)
MAVNLFRSQRPGQPLTAERAERLQGMIQNDYQLIWRLLRRLGVPADQVDDAAQQVFLIATERLDDILANRERAFAFGTALRIAQGWRRRQQRETPSDALLQRALDAMPLELRSVFILFELEAMTSPQIAELADLPLGTVASRLRRAREQFRVLIEAEAIRPGKREAP